jgi:glutathione S-transferase
MPARTRSPTILAHELSRSERMIDLREDQIGHPLMHSKLTLAQIALIAGLQMALQIADFDWRPSHPKLTDWADRIGKRPSVSATLPSI